MGNEQARAYYLKFELQVTGGHAGTLRFEQWATGEQHRYLLLGNWWAKGQFTYSEIGPFLAD